MPGGETIRDIDSVFFALLTLSVMALSGALHALQIEGYGPGAVERVGLGALTVLPSVVGVALIFVGYLAPLHPVAQNLLLLGFVVATVASLPWRW